MWPHQSKFHACVELGLLEDVEKFIKAGYDVNEVDEYKRTATILAAERNDLRLLQILCNAGAYVDMMDSFGCSPMTFACKNKNHEMISFLESKQHRCVIL